MTRPTLRRPSAFELAQRRRRRIEELLEFIPAVYDLDPIHQRQAVRMAREQLQMWVRETQDALSGIGSRRLRKRLELDLDELQDAPDIGARLTAAYKNRVRLLSDQ